VESKANITRAAKIIETFRLLISTAVSHEITVEAIDVKRRSIKSHRKHLYYAGLANVGVIRD